MPIDDPEDRGTEKDGSKSKTYCKYCYKDGVFTDPGMTLERMKEITKTEMKKRNLPDNLLEQSLRMLPGLKRWNLANKQ